MQAGDPVVNFDWESRLTFSRTPFRTSGTLPASSPPRLNHASSPRTGSSDSPGHPGIVLDEYRLSAPRTPAKRTLLPLGPNTPHISKPANSTIRSPSPSTLLARKKLKSDVMYPVRDSPNNPFVVHDPPPSPSTNQASRLYDTIHPVRDSPNNPFIVDDPPAAEQESRLSTPHTPARHNT
ncbi:hypothetical protein C8Q70DRAFT_1055244 [Cubamyces menziesii]|nr:hypothetical protein C8Q70DRAFT_1055244 [Cubamyces menziesii]